jgi:type VI secretion system protein ImpK
MFGRKRPPRSRRPERPRDDDASVGGGRRGLLETVIIRAGAAPRRSATVAAPAPARLVDLAAEWLENVVALRRVHELVNAETLRERMLEQKTRFEQRARQGGFSSADIEAGAFAIVAFLDETVLGKPGEARRIWVRRPLADEFTSGRDAGDLFYERLEQLRRERGARIAPIEVVAACLALGYDGGLEPTRLAELLKELEREIAAERGTGRGPLSPHVGRSDEHAGEIAGAVPVWLSLVVFLPAILLVWIVIALLSHAGAGHVARDLRALLVP